VFLGRVPRRTPGRHRHGLRLGRSRSGRLGADHARGVRAGLKDAERLGVTDLFDAQLRRRRWRVPTRWAGHQRGVAPKDVASLGRVLRRPTAPERPRAADARLEERVQPLGQALGLLRFFRAAASVAAAGALESAIDGDMRLH
jgi:hypothetical protein